MKALKIAALFLLLAALMSTNANSVVAEALMTPTECTVARVAERYITIHYPDFDSIKNPPVIRDKGEVWIVEYQLPEEMIGGTPVIEIEKSSLSVLKAHRTQ